MLFPAREFIKVKRDVSHHSHQLLASDTGLNGLNGVAVAQSDGSVERDQHTMTAHCRLICRHLGLHRKRTAIRQCSTSTCICGIHLLDVSNTFGFTHIQSIPQAMHESPINLNSPAGLFPDIVQINSLVSRDTSSCSPACCEIDMQTMDIGAASDGELTRLRGLSSHPSQQDRDGAH